MTQRTRHTEYLSQQWRAYTESLVVDWPTRAGFLRHIVGRGGQGPVLDDPDAIEDFLRARWQLPVLRIGSTLLGDATTVHGTRRDAEQLGRFSLRHLSLFDHGSGYIVVDADHYTRRALWTLLHELGHIAHHVELFMRVGDSYREICKRPELERNLHSSLRSALATPRLERAADLFAAHWLLAGHGSTSPKPRQEVAPWLYGLLCKAFDGRYPDASPAPGGAVASGAALRWLSRMSGRPYSARSAPLYRASWALLAAYDDPAGLPADGPSHMPAAAPDGALRRLSAAGVRDWALGDAWDPVIVCHPDVAPDHYVPITPAHGVPPGTEADCLWLNMFKRTGRLTEGRPLGEWLEPRRSSARSGLMLFPRTPAERELDVSGFVRS